MCFECDQWFTNSSEWEYHCQQHLEAPGDLLRCDPLVFRNAPIKPGFCPFYLGNSCMSPSKRMLQFVVSPPEWHSHIDKHLKGLTSDYDCKHPACSTRIKTLEELTYHLSDTHFWVPRRTSPTKRKLAAITS